MDFYQFREANFCKFLTVFLIAALILPSFSLLAQEVCDTREECEALLKKYEEQIKQISALEGVAKQEIRTLQSQINAIKSRIGQLDLEIRKGNIIIQDLGLQIQDTEGSIEKTTLEIENKREKLAQILRTIYEEDQKSLVEILLSESTLSGFFDNLMALETLTQRNQEILEDIKGLKSDLEKQKEKLDEEKDSLARTVKVQTLEKQQREELRKEQERILKMTEAQYRQYVQEKKELEKRAAEIMSRIAQLTLPGLAVPRSRKELHELASWAGKLTGVRPALILGLIEVESALGINVGQCNCAGQPVCRHPELSYKQVMRSNQWPAFEAIVAELGLNPNTTPVSCYVSGGQVQMGGAMGPAQFMPNTWLNLGYKQRVESIAGIKPANPWRASDAFLAAALYLSDWNAQTQNRNSEIGAVTAYLCGTSIMTATCSRAGGKSYRNLVMQKTDQWQKWIEEGI